MIGHIYPRGKNSWGLVFDVGKKPNGGRKQETHTVHGTRKDAQRELTRLLNEVYNGTYVESSKLTVAEYLEQWLKDYAKTSVGAKTYERYAEIVHKHLTPALGRHKLEKLEPLHIQSYYSEALENGRVDGKGGLSSTTVRQHHAVLRKALKCAVRWRLIPRNVAEDVDSPRPAKTKKEAYAPEEVKALLDSSANQPYGTIILLATATGCRLGEILALTWDDLDVKNRCIKITKSLEQTKNGIGLKTPKSKAGIRTVVIPRRALGRLATFKRMQKAKMTELEGVWVDNNLICPDACGGYRKPDSVSSCFRDWAKTAGIRSLGIHALRHTEISMLAVRGCDINTNKERSGHSTITVTGDVYVHVPSASHYRAADLLDDLF